MTSAVCGIASPTQHRDLMILHWERTGTSYRTQIGFHPCSQYQSHAYSKRQWGCVSMDQGCWVFLPHGQWPRPPTQGYVDGCQGNGRIIFRAHLMIWFSSSHPVSSSLLLLCTPLSSSPSLLPLMHVPGTHGTDGVTALTAEVIYLYPEQAQNREEIAQMDTNCASKITLALTEEEGGCSEPWPSLGRLRVSLGQWAGC